MPCIKCQTHLSLSIAIATTEMPPVPVTFIILQITVTPEFTEREKEIILACRDGLLCKEIADRLGISTHTVKAHKNNIFAKLGINNTMEMVQYALKKGIIRIEN